MATLVDDGALDWDRKVTDIFPSFALSDPTSTPKIRVRDLVSHSSGVPQFDMPFMLEHLGPMELIASIRDIPVVAAPGEVYGYSNQRYAAGGWVAALAAGNSSTLRDGALALGPRAARVGDARSSEGPAQRGPATHPLRSRHRNALTHEGNV